MPDLADRNAREADLSAKILAALVALRASIDAGQPDYGTFTAELQAALVASIADTFAAAASQLAKMHGEDKADFVDATSSAASFAMTIAATTAINAAANTQAAVADPKNPDLARWFSKARADSIAITETTRAISQGEDWSAAALALILLRKSTWFWVTEEDADVCPICAPLNGQEEPDAEQPAHPGCRCRKRYDFSRPLFGAAA